MGETTIKFTYTAINRRETVEDSSGTTKYSYDVRDRITKKETPNGTLSYTYDENGNETVVTSNNPNGVDTKYQYDELNRIVGVNGAKYSYDEVGNLTNNELPNGVKTTYTYNNVNRLKEMNSGVASYSYTLNSIGNRIKVRENGVRDVTYKYDEVNRLTEEKVIGVGTISYSYDDVGNRQTRTSTIPGITSTTYSYNSNDQFTTDTYDANGSTTKSGSTTYEYDFENRIKSVKTPTTNITITYDADGNRTSKTVNGTTTKYLVDTNNPTGYAQVVEEIQSGKTIKTYTYGLNLVSQREISAAKTSYYGYDGQNIRYLTDDKGKVTDTYTYDAFGTLINKTGTTENNYLYAGEQYDEDLNFYYNRARYLNTETGRFQSRDSYEGSQYDPQSLHKYLYAGNSPVNMRDPSGQFSMGEASVAAAMTSAIGAFSYLSVRNYYLSQESAANRPGGAIIYQNVVKSSQYGFYKEIYIDINGTDAWNRFLIVQWHKGTFSVNNYIQVKPLHQNSTGVPWQFKDWAIDSFTSLAEYPGDSSLKGNYNYIRLYDAPGIMGSLKNGSIYDANIEFKVNVYDRLKVSNNVYAFRTPDDPKPLLSIKWDFKETLQVP